MGKLYRQRKNAERLTEFVRAFPCCLDLDKPKPLAVGIFDQMLPTYDLKLLRKVLPAYTARKRYLYALIKEGAVRVNIDGSISTEVDKAHKAEAKLRLEKIRDKNKKQIEHKMTIENQKTESK